ncbi:aminotransferase [Paenibacillus baekrokdamisoli]|uniref:Aminotransferase n=1 Tax=Paenibacillus baekrokdamisoli TaxID=1712516 RepID=A0A3G9JI40_9BACL|nr:aminotransferase class V-fold PLP-dependent enzyme [Paenibacillus baekrokdamisoli]MBB3071340.1 selenocysteine lyase/cysteine desulfurase [Paenibacillus baekrokdamisoli]BBH24623.1 aminotransferase [Paenibacillus baekrokdamisoli]
MNAQTNMNALVNKKSFIGLENCTWLYSGAEAPLHQGCQDAINEYISFRGKGPDGRKRNAEVEQSCKENVARLLQGKPSDIAFVSNTSEAMSMIAHSLDFKEGDNVVIHTLEFPSGILPWLQLKNNGLKVRVVQHRDWEISIEDIMDQVDERTKLVVTSHVSYLTGARLDYKELYSELKKTETLLLLDATQSLGAVPVNMNDADFVVCSSYKWLLSTHGLGVIAVNPRRVADFAPRAVGWRSVTDMFSPTRFENFSFHEDARRFELGFPSYPTVYATNFSAGFLLEQGIERIEQHILSLGSRLIEQLTDLGFEVMTPAAPHNRAGNISVASDRGEQIAEMLRVHNIYVWGGDGRFRVSVHLFNDTEDLDKLVDTLKGFK